MIIWMIIIIILTISMILSYYLIPNSSEIVVVHAYGILLVSLAVLYRVFKKMRIKRIESLMSELNYLRMKLAQFEQNLDEQEMLDEDVDEKEGSEL
ncbi:hypothetical protein DRQ29_03700 [bacterium]|nr:MAG: hypothetical protein DRQ29_03700 [bacterium]